MRTRITKFGTTVITAEEGKVLLGKDGGISKELYLAKSDSSENYEEIDEPIESVEEIVEE